MLFLPGLAAGDTQVLTDTVGNGFRHMLLIGVQVNGVGLLFGR